MAESDAWQSFLERLLQGTLTDEDRVRLRRVLLISGQGNVLQVGKYNINIGQGQNIQIGNRVYQGPDLETLRRVVREVQADIAADRYAASLQAYFAALREYCRNLPYLTLYDIRPPKKLDEVYVPLQLRERRPEHEPGSKGDETQRFPASTPDTLSIAEVLQQARKSHLLILGEPGAGKSTLLRRLAEQAWDNPQAIGLQRPYLPMLIPLRMLASRSGALDRRLAAALSDELSLVEDLPEGFFRAWAQQMDAPWLLLLDGLDEVPEGRRTGLLQWLDGILPLVGEGRVIITARPSVYNSKEWEYKPFSAYNIQPFTPEQARALAEKWFGDEAFAFLHALENVRAAALSGTPLLLTIAAKVYLRHKEETGVGSLPERRSKLYEEFIDETLLKEAKTRGLGVELGDDVADLAKPALARLALAMTEHPDWMDEDRLAQVAAEYLREELHLGRDLAETRGRRFVQVMGRRSGVLLRRGGTYEWLHPTFREYLTAWWVVKNCRGRFRRVWDSLIVYYEEEQHLHSALWAIDILGVENVTHQVTSKLAQHVSRRKGLEYSLAQLAIVPLLLGLSEWKFYHILFSIGLNSTMLNFG